MELRWTEEAAADLERLADDLFEHVPGQANRLIGTLYEAPEKLKTFPRLGRHGSKEGTRELALPPLPYVLIYAVREETIFVARALHGAQKWP